MSYHCFLGKDLSNKDSPILEEHVKNSNIDLSKKDPLASLEKHLKNSNLDWLWHEDIADSPKKDKSFNEMDALDDLEEELFHLEGTIKR